MPRQPRIEYDGAMYHVMSRGNRGCDIYQDDTDRAVFLDTLEQACSKTGWVVHAYVLMTTHFHVLLETPEANLVSGMQWFQSTYTMRYNVRHREHGHLFQGRYKALLIDPESEAYFSVVSSYIHLNPARAKMFDLTDGKLTDYAWSSYVHYLRPSKRPAWLTVDRVFGCLGFDDNTKGRGAYRRYMQARVAEMAGIENTYELDPDWSKIRRGWCLGDGAFRDKLLGYLEDVKAGKKSTSLSGEIIKCHNEREAKRLVDCGLNVLGIAYDSLEVLRKGAIEKQLLAWLLRRHTTVSNEWVANYLFCGHPGGVARFVKCVEQSKDRKIRALKKKLIKTIDR